MQECAHIYGLLLHVLSEIAAIWWHHVEQKNSLLLSVNTCPSFVRRRQLISVLCEDRRNALWFSATVQISSMWKSPPPRSLMKDTYMSFMGHLVSSSITEATLISRMHWFADTWQFYRLSFYKGSSCWLVTFNWFGITRRFLCNTRVFCFNRFNPFLREKRIVQNIIK